MSDRLKVLVYIKKIGELSFYEWRVFIMALLVLPVVSITLKVRGYNCTKEWFARKSRKKTVDGCKDKQWLSKAESTVRMVSLAARLILGEGSCLRRALVSQWLLAKEGIYTELKLGVKKTKYDFSAHAWLVYDGVVLGDSQNVDKKYSIF